MNIHTKPADKGGTYLAYVFKNISVQLLPEQRPQWTWDTRDKIQTLQNSSKSHLTGNSTTKNPWSKRGEGGVGGVKGRFSELLCYFKCPDSISNYKM